MAVFHFDLRHARDAHELRVQVLGATYDLVAHDSDGLTAAAASNRALGALPDEGRLSFSHTAEVADHHFGDDAMRWVTVVRPTPADVHLDECVLMSQYLPEDHLRAYYRRTFDRYERHSVDELRLRHRANLQGKPRVHSGKLASLGLGALPEDADEAIELLLHARHLITLGDTATSFIKFHPSLQTVQPATAAVIEHDHIFPDPDVDPDQYNAVVALATTIGNTDPWSPVVECRDKDDKPIKADFDLKDKTGGFTKGQQLYSWDVAQPVLDVAVKPMAGACRTAADDPSLSNHVWSPTPGTSVVVKDGGDAVAEAAPEGTDFKWTVDNETYNYGVKVMKKSIKVDAGDKLSVDSYNIFLRTLYVGYVLLDETQSPIPGTHEIGQLSAGDSIAGIPCPIDPTPLQLDLQGAAGVRLLFGSLGTSDWEGELSTKGALLTGFWQYGVPVFFMAMGAKFTASETYAKIMKDPDVVKAIVAVGGFVVGAGVATATAVTNSAHYLILLANKVASLALKEGMEAFADWLLKQVAGATIAAAFGPVGWVFKGAAALMNVEGMAITTVEVLSSPACVRVNCTRAIDVAVTMHPDPRHGESGRPETAIWPSLAERYVATLVYRGGTAKQLIGQLPRTTAKDPLPLKFLDVPAGGEFRIVFGVYSSSGWLAGSWQSDWMAAKPNKEKLLDLGDPTITESLVPLAGDTQYVFKERIAYAGDHFSWKAGGAPPSTPHTALDCGPSGTLCELVDATFNNSAFQLGYAWRSSRQGLPPDSAAAPPSGAQLYALQSLSVLDDPGSRLIRSDVGLTNRPAIAYAPSTNAKDHIDEANFVVDPRGGGMHLRQVALDGTQHAFGLGAKDLKSWGRFPLENVDAAAVHPTNAVIACSWKHRKLMIMPLPATPSPDDKVPSALIVSGQGLREGLVQGPAALAVAPDGRILVLETLNRRVQAFDTKGNPVPSFTPGPVTFSLPTGDVAPILDKGQVPEALQDGLHAAGAGFLFALESKWAKQLDSGRFQPKDDPLIKELSTHQIVLSYDPARMGDAAVSAQIKVVKPGSAWTISDPRDMAWQVLAEDGGLSVYPRIGRAEVRTVKAGHEWLVIDGVGGAAFKLSPSPTSTTETDVRACVSFFPLRGVRDREITYLDLAVEAQGYVYVLSHQMDGPQPADYLLDVYAPDGRWLFRTPDPSLSKTPQNVVAGKLAIDIWRNLYAITYETLRGPDGAPQPGVAHWMPTPPLFTLPLTEQRGFDEGNIGAVQAAFASRGVKLTKDAFVTPIEKGGAWQVKDGANVYDVYRSGDGLQAYALSA
ncbi:MAG TPA: hypothetical protein VF529_14155 [Solirubrobacteraceae bacterium]|jgi:hypothetical protein